MRKVQSKYIFSYSLILLISPQKLKDTMKRISSIAAFKMELKSTCSLKTQWKVEIVNSKVQLIDLLCKNLLFYDMKHF